MKLVQYRINLAQLVEFLKNSHEGFYLAGLKFIQRDEIIRYLAKSFIDRSGKADCIGAFDERDSLVGIALFHKSSWDSVLLKVNIAKLDLIVTRKNLKNRSYIYSKLIDEVIFACRKRGSKIIFFRNPSSDTLLHNALLKKRAYPASKSLNLHYLLKNYEKKGKICPASDILIRPPKKNEYRSIIGIMESGYDNRLLKEHIFLEKHVRDLYREWVSNDLLGRVKYFFAALFKGKTAGFIAFDRLNIGGEAIGFIDMIIVGRNFRGKGIGRILLQAAINKLSKQTKAVILSTESENKDVVRFYLHSHFKLFGSSIYYHIHI